PLEAPVMRTIWLAMVMVDSLGFMKGFSGGLKTDGQSRCKHRRIGCRLRHATRSAYAKRP
ncbi:MAG: hypothetical protein Q4C79_12965, partial [Neisseria sp.]|uniref:hypothetical protein n=1 Tax=Neisseria sp. TaxID=192066 RepID=UPI0026DB97A9